MGDVNEQLCISCRQRIGDRRTYSWASREEYIDIAQIVIEDLLNREVQYTDFICRPCWQRAERRYQRNIRDANRVPDDIAPNVPVAEDDVVHPRTLNLQGFRRTPITRNSCVHQHCQNTSRHRIPDAIILRMLCRYHLLIPDNTRVCVEHLEQNSWHLLAVQENNIEEFTADQIVNALTILTNHATTEVLDFEHYETINDNEFHKWTGLTHEQFSDLLQNTPSLNSTRKKRTMLAALLAKLRTGDSNARQASIFKTSESTFARMLQTARDALTQDFIPLHLGWGHMTREEVSRRNLTIPKNIFGNPNSPPDQRKAITIVDGTYIFIQKSSNYFFQRKSYSNHKFRNLLKPFLFVCCDGHIIEVSGPHAATTSDAQIMSSIIHNENEDGDGLFNWFYREGEVFILDRGFRDAAPELRDLGYAVKMPESRLPSESQLTTEQANKSRLVKICRWVVEVINGRFKRDFEVSGPHAATTSDAQIMSSIIHNENEDGDGLFNWFYREGEVFILDRGFRDAAPELRDLGYVVKMPESRLPSESQLTTEQANKSRLVKICRWVVEVINGRFKRDFRLLRNVYINRTLLAMFEYFRIAAALLNAFHVLIEDNIRVSEFLEIIEKRINMPNTLADLVNRHNYNRRRAHFQTMSALMPQFDAFPRLNEDELILFSLGTYQLKQARSYYGEHLQPDGSFVVELAAETLEHVRSLEGEDLFLIRGRTQSRDIRAKTYNVYIAIDRARNGRQAIKHYYCTCNIGKRTLGRCSHTMCILWYNMCFARHEEEAIRPPAGLEDVIVRLEET